MPFRDLVKYVFIAKRQGYYIARQAMLSHGYGLNEIAIMLTFRLNQIAEEMPVKPRFTAHKVRQVFIF